MIEVFMPKAGMDMKEGTLIRWLKNVGDHVELNEPIMEIETDKINMEAEAPGTGIFLAKLIEDGTTVPVLQTIGYIGEPDEKIPENRKESVVESAIPSSIELTQTEQTAVSVPGGEIAATPYAKKLALDAGISLDSISSSSSTGEIRGRDVEAALEHSRFAATPLAKKYAEVEGIKLDGIDGSGFGGKICKGDVLRAKTAHSVAEESDFSTDGTGRTVENRCPVQGMRKVVGERMFNSYNQIPTVMQSMRVDLTDLLAFRDQINENRQKRISINDLVLKATAIAVKEMPHCRTAIIGSEFVTYAEANIGFAVSVDDGLFVPVIHNADQLSLSQLSARAGELAEKARKGTILPDEYTGGTFTVSNMGMFDVYEFAPIINQPECGLLGIGGIHDELALKEGEVVTRKIALLCMSYDHRIMDGVGAAKLKSRVKELLQNPMEILL